MTEINRNQLADCLRNTFHPDPAVRKPAEKYLESIEHSEGYSALLLSLLQNNEVPLEVRVACAVTFKNFVKRNWQESLSDISGFGDISKPVDKKICENDRTFVKQQIINVMLVAPDSVKRQVSEAISLIAKEDFPEEWRDLLPTLVNHLAGKDFHVIGSVLQTAHSLFKRYRHEIRSNELWSEIKYVLDVFALPLTELMKRTVEEAKSLVGNNSQAVTLRPVFECLVLEAKIFNSLNAQELPEFFEDNMAVWMGTFLELVKLDVPALCTGGADEAGVLEHLKSQICENISMYAQKYEEEFAQCLPPFVEVVWGLLVTVGAQPKFDLLVSNAIQFLACVCERDQYKQLFETEGTLAQICERVIVPNMEFRVSDLETFEDNPEEFIRRDIEGSDVDSRRRAASDFVKALCKYFEPKIIEIFSGYIQHLFTGYASDPEMNWPKKDAAVFLVTSLASRGQTARHGTTKTSELVNLVDFFNTQILPDLGGDVNKFPVLKAGALKYLVSFRSHLNKDLLLVGMRAAVNLLAAESVVVHTYAAHALERICVMRNPQNPSTPLIQGADLEPMTNELLINLFGILEKEGSEENEYAMKCIMRSMTVLQESCVKHSEVILGRLSDKLLLVAKNPNKPLFNHYLFESICVLIKQVCKSRPTENACRFEAALFPVFQQILQQDVVEFMPYVFQVLAMQLDMREENTTIPTPYMELFPFLLVPALWEKLGNIPALVRLLRAYIKVNMTQIVDGNHLNPLLGVFQKLIASKSNDHEGFNILYSLLEYTTWEQLKGSMKGILLLLFQRLQHSKTSKFVKNMITFIWLFAVKQGVEELVGQLDVIQNGMFGMILEKIIIPDMQKVNGNLEKKICCVGVTRALTESSYLLPGGKYSTFWVPLLQAVVGLFELPEEDSADDEQFLDVETQAGYSAAFSQLAFASHADTDPTGVADPKICLAKALEKVAVNHPDMKIRELVKQIDPRAVQFLQSYCRTAGVTLI